jgi:hypothetical protein
VRGAKSGQMPKLYRVLPANEQINIQNDEILLLVIPVVSVATDQLAKVEILILSV